jgi:hypothetical protein
MYIMFNNVGNLLDNVMFFFGYIREQIILVGSNLDDILNGLTGPVVVYNVYGGEMVMGNGCY